VLVPERVWGFKSPLGHQTGRYFPKVDTLEHAAV